MDHHPGDADADRNVCRYCGGDIRRLGADGPSDTRSTTGEPDPSPGNWTEPVTGSRCPGNTARVHLPFAADTDNTIGRQALAAVVSRHYAGNWTAAIDDLAAEGQVAVAHFDYADLRAYAQHTYDVTLTDEQWGVIVDLLNQFDEYVLVQTGGAGSFINRALLRAGAISVFDIHREFGATPDRTWKWLER